MGIKWHENFSALLELVWFKSCLNLGFLLQTHQKTASVQRTRTPPNPPKPAHAMVLSSVENKDKEIENLIFFGVYTNKSLLLSIYTQYIVRINWTLLSLSVSFLYILITINEITVFKGTCTSIILLTRTNYQPRHIV